MTSSIETRTLTAVEALAPSVTPSFRLASATLNGQDLGEVGAWLSTNPQITQGAQVREMEQAWSNWLGRHHTAFVSSGTTANEVAARAAMETGRVTRRVVVQAAGSWVTTISPWMNFVHPVSGDPIEVIMCGNEYPSLSINVRRLEELCERQRPDAVIFVPTSQTSGCTKRGSRVNWGCSCLTTRMGSHVRSRARCWRRTSLTATRSSRRSAMRVSKRV